MTKHIPSTIHIHIHRDGTQDSESIRPGAGIAWVAPDHKVLLLRRAAESVFGGTWCFPAGGIEPQESPVQAAWREFSEETGLRHSFAPPKQARPIWTSDRFSLFLARGHKFTPLLNHEHDDFIWADLDHPPKPLHPNVREQILKLKGLET